MTKKHKKENRNMKKTNHTDHAAAYEQAKEIAAAATAACDAFVAEHPESHTNDKSPESLEIRARRLELEVIRLRAADELEQIARAYDRHLIADAAAEGDADAIAASPAHIVADMRAELAEAARLNELAEQARLRAAERPAAGRAAKRRIAERRRAAGLPLPTMVIPDGVSRTGAAGGGFDKRPETVLRAIEAAAGAARESRAEEIHSTEREATRFRVRAETCRREIEAKQRETEKWQRKREEEKAVRERAQRRATEEWRAKVRANEDRERELAEASRQRSNL